MPIFAYRCERCGFEKDILQKRSDPPLDTCPSCGEKSFGKRLTAPAFQLKGSGWYVTDFRDNGKGKSGGESSEKAGEKATGKAADNAGGDATAATPAPAPAAAPPPAPAAAPGAASPAKGA